MNSRGIVVAVSLGLTLASCSIGRSIPQATTYMVDAPTGVILPTLLRRPETLRMGYVRVAAAYAGSALVYRLDDVRYASDPYHAFVADPGAMLGSRMAEWLDRSGPFSAVAPPGSAQPAPYVLEATVEELYGDFRAGRPPAAMLSVQFALIDQASARPKVVYERTFTARVNLSTASPDALVGGYGTALAEVLSQVAADLSARFEH
jgi:cholesterol transport system auxiliary component